ncbi:helix-turn-helix transcriptional regulator [Pantoea endophytica]
MQKSSSRKVIRFNNGINRKFLVADIFPIYANGLVSILNARQTTVLNNDELDAPLLLQELFDDRPDAVFISCDSKKDIHIINSINNVYMNKIMPIFALTDTPRTTPLTPYLCRDVVAIPRSSTPEEILYKVNQEVKAASQHTTAKTPSRTVPYKVTLTPCEKKVLQRMLRGESLSLIAFNLERSVKTISTQKRRAKQRLGLESDAELYWFLNSPDGQECLI